MRKIILEGSPYEIGFKFGLEAKHCITAFIQGICNTMKLSLTEAEIYEGEKKIEVFDKLLRKKYPEIASEIEGIAAGSGISYEETLWYNSYEELFFNELTASYRCSNISFLLSDDGPLLGKTNDIMFYRLSHYRMMRIKPVNGYDLMQIGALGTYMTNAGINSAGLAYGGAGLFTKGENSDGVPHTFLQRLVLQNCENVKEAIIYIKECNLMRVGMHMSLIDAKGDGVIIGKMPEGMYIKYPNSDGTMFCSNHILDESYADVAEDFPILIPNSVNRYENLGQLAVHPHKNIAYMKEILRNHNEPGAICQHGQGGGLYTVLAYIIQVNKKRFFLSEGYPCINEFQSFDFDHFS